MSRRQIQSLGLPLFLLDGDPLCAQSDPNIFFPIDMEDTYGRPTSVYSDLKTAKAICASCPLKFDCLDYAIKNYETGIWGGTTEAQRASLRRGRLRAV